MAKSTRSQDALLAVVVLSTVFAVPALELYVQLTHREDVWGPAVKSLFGLGLVLSIGLGYRKWQRDRAARNPEKHLPRPPAASTCASCGATSLAFSLDGRVFCDRCGRDATAVSTVLAGARPPTPHDAAPVPIDAVPARPQPAPRTRARFDPLHAASLAVIVAFLLVAALVYALLWLDDEPRDTVQHQRGASTAVPQDENAHETRLVFPGWEDLVIGKEPPADARQRCERVLGADSRMDDCNGCRSANLPLPCVRVLLEDGVVWAVSAEIPDGEERIARVLAAIHSGWGKPTKHLRNSSVDTDCWYRQVDHASYNSLKFDLSRLRPDDPIRTITILARDMIDNCAPDGTPSTVRDNGAKRKTTDAAYAAWERCMEKHCEGEMWAGGECQYTVEEGADLADWCREEWAATSRCSKKYCAKFETE